MKKVSDLIQIACLLHIERLKGVCYFNWRQIWHYALHGGAHDLIKLDQEMTWVKSIHLHQRFREVSLQLKGYGPTLIPVRVNSWIDHSLCQNTPLTVAKKEKKKEQEKRRHD